ncbi:MAG TPA: MOSC domain-containing protein [Actinomycetota bacterium]|nr:MOSC domain-containing protein [Actinomycetota bacterium]
MKHLSRLELEAGLGHIRASPTPDGTLALIVRRPATNERETVGAAVLDAEVGLIGDNWLVRGSKSPGGLASIDHQITVMNVRAAALVAADAGRRQLCGDQLYVDLDLSAERLPAGSLLAIGGEVVLQVSPEPHLGCIKFRERFGTDVLAFVNSKVGRAVRLRGLNARIVAGGAVRLGDPVTALPPADAWPTPAPTLRGDPLDEPSMFQHNASG